MFEIFIKNCKTSVDFYKEIFCKIYMIAKKIIFFGQVQGVGFRFTAHSVARRYDLTGFVRNMPDGSVEMLAQGQSADVEMCLRDIGESFAGYIRKTQIDDIEPDSSFKDFRITF